MILSGQAKAADICYSSQQAKADAALRYHAELRIIGLTCSMYPSYQLFTTNNGALLKTYQDSLTGFYKAHYKGDPSSRFHAYETQVENEDALAVAKQGHADFCRRHSAELQSMVLASAGQVKQQIDAFEMSNPGPGKKCIR